jgi:hypothetical protein
MKSASSLVLSDRLALDLVASLSLSWFAAVELAKKQAQISSSPKNTHTHLRNLSGKVYFIHQEIHFSCTYHNGTIYLPGHYNQGHHFSHFWNPNPSGIGLSTFIRRKLKEERCLGIIPLSELVESIVDFYGKPYFYGPNIEGTQAVIYRA